MVKKFNIRDRYKIVPQMEFYDKLSCVYKPFVMFFNVPNFKSRIVNTDELGFRLNFYNNELTKLTSLYNKPKVTIVIGGSLVFGFGSTSDKKTISSILSKKKNNIYINFGATAFNSKQEILLFLNFFQKFNNIEKVIIISGANDLYLNLINIYDDWGNFFFKEKYQKIFEKSNNRSNIILKIKKKYSKIFKNNTQNKTMSINFEELKNNYLENFSLWSSISKNFNFKIHFFLQPMASWTKKKLSINEMELFNILDNSNDFAHLTLKEISKYENYIEFSKLLKNLTDLYQINFTDLNQEINKSNNLDNSIFVDRIHMNDLGYDEITKIILNYI